MVEATPPDSLLQLCNRAVALGNSISVQMLEFLSTVKHQPIGFRDLGYEFLDICNVLTAIEKGLADFLKSEQSFPHGMVSQLDQKFRQTIEDFTILKKLLEKFIDFEKGGAVALLQKTWRMLVADKDIARVSSSLKGNHEALKMSMIVFSWTPNAQAVFTSPEYQTLAAELDRRTNDSTAPTSPQGSLVPSELEGPSVKTEEVVELGDTGVARPTQKHDVQSMSPAISALSLGGESNLTITSPSVMSTDGSSYAPKSFAVQPTSSQPEQPVIASVMHEEDSGKEVLAPVVEEAATPIPDAIGEAQKPPRIKADVTKMPHRTPANPSPSNPASLGNALVSAVQGGKFEMVEKLLERGVSPDTAPPKVALREAVLKRDLKCVRLLLEFGANPDALDQDNVSPLTVACGIGHMESAVLLLQYGADPNGMGIESPLTRAIQLNKADFVSLFCMYGGDPNFVQSNGATALSRAINASTSVENLETLLNYNGDIGAKDKNGLSTLHQAITQRRPDMMRLLLQRGADPKPFPDLVEMAVTAQNKELVEALYTAGADINGFGPYGWSPIATAVRYGLTDILNILLNGGADPNVGGHDLPIRLAANQPAILKILVEAGANLHTPPGILEKAVVAGNIDSVRYLLDQGVDPNAKVDDIFTPLATAIRIDNVTILDELLARGTDPNLKGHDWPLSLALRKPEVLKKLISSGANPKLDEYRGIIEVAVAHDHFESVKILVAAGISVEDKMHGIFTPLGTAARELRLDIMRFLVEEAGADVNASGEHLPLVLAVRRSHIDIVKYLLDKGADPGKQWHGWNSVMQAADINNTEALKLLLGKGGVDLDLKDDWGKTALDIAAGKGHDEVVELLLENM